MTREERIAQAKAIAPCNPIQEREGLATGDLVIVNADMMALMQEDLAEQRAEISRLRKAITAVNALKVTGPSTIGPLHAAGVEDGIRWVKETISRALSSIPTPPCPHSAQSKTLGPIYSGTPDRN